MKRLWPVVLFAVAPGCVALPGERPLPVQAVDAETRQPIRGANVQIAYSLAPSMWAAHDSAGTTGADGIVRLKIASGDDPAVTVNVAAPGYLPDGKPLSTAAVHALEPPHLFELTDHRPPAVVVELYAEPRPTVDLVLPAGFRGRVRATVRIQDEATIPSGLRTFGYDVSTDGAVDVVGPPILRRVFAPDFRLRYSDAAPLTQNAKESEVGYWWLKSEGDTQVFLVGTRADFDAAVRAGEATTTGLPRNGPGGGGGGGKGGRRGGRRGGGM